MNLLFKLKKDKGIIPNLILHNPNTLSLRKELKNLNLYDNGGIY
jgi:hypothetical protein